MRTPLTFAVMLAGTVIAACAATAPSAQRAAGTANRQCFLASQVNDFWGATDDSVLVRVGVSQVYRLQLAGMCHDIDWANRIALRSTGGSSWICQGLDAELLIPSPIGAQRCLVTDIRKLSPEESKLARGRRG
jgi:hypothetical protein